MVRRRKNIPPPPPPPFLGGSSTSSSRSSDVRTSMRSGKILSIPADALVYMFPEYFAKKATFGGFKAPYASVKVSHNSLFKSMVTATLAYLLHSGVAMAKLIKVGRIFKHEEIVLVKLKQFRQSDYGVLTWCLSGKNTREAKLVNCVMSVIGSDKSSPDKEYIRTVYNYSVKKHVKIRSNLDLEKYRREAQQLYSIWIQQKQAYPRIYYVAEDNAMRAANACKPRDYDY